MDNVDNMDNTAPVYSPAPDMDKYRQRGQTPDVWRREDRPRAVLLPVCSVCPFV